MKCRCWPGNIDAINATIAGHAVDHLCKQCVRDARLIYLGSLKIFPNGLPYVYEELSVKNVSDAERVIKIIEGEVSQDFPNV